MTKFFKINSTISSYSSTDILLGNPTLEIMINRGKAELKPIEKDERTKDRGYFCIVCGSAATQTALFKIEGATIVERYCDNCAKSVNKC